MGMSSFEDRSKKKCQCNNENECKNEVCGCSESRQQQLDKIRKKPER